MVGTQIGPYHIVRLLGKGGMGEVYEGRHEQLQRRVAIKVLLGDIATDPKTVARFFNERHEEKLRRKIDDFNRWGSGEETLPRFTNGRNPRRHVVR